MPGRTHRRALHGLASALLLLGGAALPACGYRAVRYGEPQGSIAVSTLVNESAEPGIDLTVADALRREFLRRGALRVVEDPDAADYVISGRVLPTRSVAKTFSSIVLALEYQITLQLDLQVTAREGSRRALPQRLLIERELYTASADIEVLRKNRREALRRAASVIATRIHDVLTERTLE